VTVAISVMDRHRFDADLDPDRRQNDADPHVDHKPSFKHVEKSELFFLLVHSIAS
jgi:hypothetical protein